MTPLRIEITLIGPVERPARPIHLDSLLASQVIRRDMPMETDIQKIRTRIEDLPLEREDIGGDWVWKASTLAFEWTSQPMQEFATRAIRPEAIANTLKTGLINNFAINTRIDTAKGSLKSAVYTHETQWARSAVAYCVGDLDEIERLLQGLDSIGARRRLGNGRIKAVEVHEDMRAHNLWSHRYLPAEAKAGRLVEGAYRLPLFERTHQRVVRDNQLEWRDAV